MASRTSRRFSCLNAAGKVRREVLGIKGMEASWAIPQVDGSLIMTSRMGYKPTIMRMDGWMRTDCAVSKLCRKVDAGACASAEACSEGKCP